MPQEGFCRSEGCLFSFFIPSSRGTTSPHPERLQSYSQGRSGHGAARQGATSTEQRWRIRSEGFGRKYSPLRVLDSHRTRFWRFFKCWLEKKPAGGVTRRRQGAPVACREWKRCVCLLAPPPNPQLPVVTMSRLSEPPNAPGEV